MTLRCPVSGKTAADTKTAPSEAVAQCSFASAAAAADASTKASESSAAAPATCPYDFGSSANSAISSSKDGAVCPMGFGSASPRDPLAALQCTRCKALFYDAVRIACGHFFCRSCISTARDCLLCGADLQDMRSEARLQDLVDLFMELDGDAATFEERAALPEGTVTTSRPPQAAAERSTQSPSAGKHATFLEGQAVRSLAGGNVDAAIQRLGLCREALQQECASSGYTPELCCRLGNIIGTQGTCLEQQGKTHAAMEAYSDSIMQLQKSLVKTPEVVQALAVSMNKLGDRKYLDNDLSGARQHYAEALALRQESCQSAESASQPGEAALAEAQLGLVTSLLKVLDIEQALGERTAAQEHRQEAQGVLRKAGESVPPEGSLRAKYIGLQAFLQQVG